MGGDAESEMAVLSVADEEAVLPGSTSAPPGGPPVGPGAPHFNAASKPKRAHTMAIEERKSVNSFDLDNASSKSVR